jgi:putative peptidoglycan lipid II flippase
LSTLLFLNLIASILLIVLAEPIVRLIFERGQFGPDATQRATFALVCLAPGLIAFSMANILARAFFALGDTRTPMRISVVCLVLNLLVTLALIGPFRQGGLGIANTISSAVNVVLLIHALRRRLERLEMQALVRTLVPLAVAGALATLVSWLGLKFWNNAVGQATIALQIGAVFVPAIVAGLAYWIAAVLFKIPAASEISHLVFQKLRRNKR